MKKEYKKTFLFAFAVSCVFPLLALAQPTGTTIKNPLEGRGINDIPTLITTIVDAITTIGYYVVVVFIIYAGFKFVSARGNDGELKKAKEIFLYTVVGAAVLLGASILSNIIKNTVIGMGGGTASAIVEQKQV